MPINFFDSRGKTNSNQGQFGLCDDPPPLRNPAYIDEQDTTKWIARVNNLSQKSVDFYAIDNLVEILRSNGEQESRCDGMLHYNNNLIFVELKDKSRSWLDEGISQLVITVNVFKASYDINSYQTVTAYLCNKKRPQFHTNHATKTQKFKDDTGLILKVQSAINL